jgi:hypothetical protein
MRDSIPVFATRADWLAGLEKLMANSGVTILARNRNSGDFATRIENLREEPNFGASEYGDQVRDAVYLIVPSQGNDDVSSIDLSTSSCLVYRPGGVFTEKCLIAGQISSSPESSPFYEAAATALTDGFKRIKAYLVGPEALKLLKSGARLTYNFRASQDFDLRLP